MIIEYIMHSQYKSFISFPGERERNEILKEHGFDLSRPIESGWVDSGESAIYFRQEAKITLKEFI